MPRKIPPCPEVPDVRCHREIRRYEIQLVTPMFGGGVEAGEVDRDFPIRGTSIRGQLQFWWRATVGAQYQTLAELRTAQSEVWGSTEHASRVKVLVENVQASEPVSCASYETDRKQPGKYRSMPSWNPPFKNTSLPYALFPFQGQLANGRTAIEVEPAMCIQQASFQMVIQCPKDLWPLVEPGVWAWLNFGGLGARTRRGCGAIRGRELDEDGENVKEIAPRDAADLAAIWKRYLPQPFPVREWPTLAATVLVGREPSDAMAAWDQVVGRFKNFRQGEGLGRSSGQRGSNRPGRSRFPEPDTIRRITNQWKGNHQPVKGIPDAFPRADFGLPIVFHFKDERAGDPPITVLYPTDDSDGNSQERMASPLILKPVALADGKAIPLILRLKTPPLRGIDLRKGDTSLPLPPSTVIRDPRLSTYRDSPLAGSPNGSVLDAFLTVAQEGYTEVTR